LKIGINTNYRDRVVSIIFQFVSVILGVIFLFLAGLWLFIPIASGLPWIPTHRTRIRKALELTNVRPGEVLYDLGAGDGRVLVLAAREYGVRAVGIELDPAHCVLIWLRALFSGVLERVSIQWGNFFKINLGEADVVYAYLTPSHAARLKPQLEKQLRPGARVATISADMEGWEPTAFDSENLIFLYHMPPTPGNLGSFLAKGEFHHTQNKPDQKRNSSSLENW
jgi:SAM-dependent methyltransferase